jgi:hypothetical protein
MKTLVIILKKVYFLKFKCIILGMSQRINESYGTCNNYGDSETVAFNNFSSEGFIMTGVLFFFFYYIAYSIRYNFTLYYYCLCCLC